MLDHGVDQAIGEEPVALRVEVAPNGPQGIELQRIARRTKRPIEIDDRQADLLNRVEHGPPIRWDLSAIVVLIGDHHEIQVATPRTDAALGRR